MLSVIIICISVRHYRTSKGVRSNPSNPPSYAPAIHFPVVSHYTTRTASRLVRSTKLSPVRQASHLDEWPTTNMMCCNNFFFSFPYEGDIKDCRTPQPCVMSFFLFLSYLFVISPCPHTHVYLQSRTNKQPNASFEFFSILLTFDGLKQ